MDAVSDAFPRPPPDDLPESLLIVALTDDLEILSPGK